MGTESVWPKAFSTFSSAVSAALGVESKSVTPEFKAALCKVWTDFYPSCALQTCFFSAPPCRPFAAPWPLLTMPPVPFPFLSHPSSLVLPVLLITWHNLPRATLPRGLKLSACKRRMV